MEIKQFYEKSLAHSSYMVLSGTEAVVIDPARNPKQYYDYALAHNVQITAVIETHPHADFISSHLDIARQTGADIYVSKLVGANYPHRTFDDGDFITLGKVRLEAMNTPGHSPDSICVVLRDENNYIHAVFTGDTLFVGDCGRPDLREGAGNIKAARESLARQMYQSLRTRLMKLDEDVLVYPAHGAGSLCGKNLSEDLVSHIGRELRENYALQPMDEDEFVRVLLRDQPFVPKYFGYDVDLNREGPPELEESISKVKRGDENMKLEKGALVIDTRDQAEFKKRHLKGAINIMLHGGKFETWLGSIVSPGEKFYMICQDEKAMDEAIMKASSIGYESRILAVLPNPATARQASPELDVEAFRAHPDNYQIVDIRNYSEVNDFKVFESSIHVPLPELRERVKEIPAGKAIVVHCARGYRSAAGASIVESAVNGKNPVYDLSKAIKDFYQ